MPRHAGNGNHGRLFESIREVVFGLQDGLVSTMGAVAGIAAGTQNVSIVVLSGVIIIVVEALSMAAGSYLSNKSHGQMLQKKIRDEREEIEAEPEAEAEELRAMYRQRGFSEDEIAILVKRITRDKKLWLEEMMAKELRIGSNDIEEPWPRAIIMGVAYVCGGSITVLPYLFLRSVSAAIAVSALATIVALFLIGFVKGGVTGLSRWKSALEMALVASCAAAIAYLIGRGFGHLFGLTGI